MESVLARPRLALAVALLSLPLALPDPAQAHLAGALPPTTTNHPDLLSVTLLGGGTDNAKFCFDKTLSNPGPLGFPNPSNFSLGGYDSVSNTSVKPFAGEQTYTASAAFLDVGNPACVEVDFPGRASTNATLTDYTFGYVEGGTVFPNGLGGAVADANFADTAPLGGSTSVTGTAGHTSGPDLVTVGAVPSGNAIDYTFDQNVDPGSVLPGNFFFDNVAGTGLHAGGGAAAPLVINGNTVRVFYAAVNDVTTAVLAGVTGGSAASAAGNHEVNTVAFGTLAVPGTIGMSIRPRVIAATLASPNQIDYTFDHSIALAGSPAAAAARCSVELANGDELFGTGATVIGPTVLRVTFPSVPGTLDEEFVWADVYGPPFGGSGPVVSLNGAGNLEGGAPVGGNIGALAEGYTNAPDARSVAFDNSTGTVTVDFDQRLDPAAVNAGDFILRAGDGTSLGAPDAVPAVIENTATPGDAQVILQYSPGTVRLAKFLEIQGPPNGQGVAVSFQSANPLDPPLNTPSAVRTFTAGGVGPYPNVQQLLAPTVPAAVFHKVGSKTIPTVVVKLHRHRRRAGRHKGSRL